MKKIIISITAASLLLFTGCFIDSDTATVRINLGNMPIAKVEKKSFIDSFLLIFAKEAVAQTGPGDFSVTTVHLGAFDSNNQLLAKKSINVGDYPENNIVNFDVPARSGVTIVVLGEKDLAPIAQIQQISYYGKSTPQNLTAGETEEVPIKMGDSYSYIIFLNNETESTAKWNRVTGASLYKIYDNNHKFIHSTGLPYFESEEPGAMYFLRIEFGFVGKDSNEIDFSLNLF